MSQFVRFYALQGLLFFVLAALAYTLVEGRVRGAAAVGTGLAILVLLAVGTHLTPVTVVGAAGIALWAALFRLVPACLERGRAGQRILGALALAGVAVLAVAWATGLLGAAWAEFRWAPDWIAEHRDSLGFYHRKLGEDYALLWPLTPVLVLLAVAWRPRPALFCITIFGVGVALHSLAGMKNLRYIAHLMPFLFAVWGMAAAAVWRAGAGLLARGAGDGLRAVDPRLARGLLVWPVVAVAVLFAAGGNPAFREALAYARGNILPERGIHWDVAAPAIQPYADAATVVASSRELQSMWHLGRTDVVPSASRMSELPDPREDFSIDPRTALPVVATPDGMAELMACTPDGILITPTEQPELTEELLSAVPAGTRIGAVEDLPPAGRLDVTRWTTATPGGDCAAVRTALGR